MEEKADKGDVSTSLDAPNYEELCLTYGRLKWKKKKLEEEHHALCSDIQALRHQSFRQYQVSEIEDENVTNHLIRKVEYAEHNVWEYEAEVSREEEASEMLAGLLHNARKEETNIENQLEANQELFLMTLQRNMMEVAKKNSTLAGLLLKEQKKYLSLLSQHMQVMAQKQQEMEQGRKQEDEGLSACEEGGHRREEKEDKHRTHRASTAGAASTTHAGSIDQLKLIGRSHFPSVTMTPNTKMESSRVGERKGKRMENGGGGVPNSANLSPNPNVVPFPAGVEGSFPPCSSLPLSSSCPPSPSPSLSFSSLTSSTSIHGSPSPSCSSLAHPGHGKLSISTRPPPSCSSSTINRAAVPPGQSTQPPPRPSSSSPPFIPSPNTTGAVVSVGKTEVPTNTMTGAPFGGSERGSTLPTTTSSSSFSSFHSSCNGTSTLQSSAHPSTRKSGVDPPFGTNKVKQLSATEDSKERKGDEGKGEGREEEENAEGKEKDRDGENKMGDLWPASPTATVPSFFLPQLRQRIDELITQNDAREKEGEEGEKLFQRLVKTFNEQQEEVSQARQEAEQLRQDLKLLRKRVSEMFRSSSVCSRRMGARVGSMGSISSQLGSGSSVFLPREDSMESTSEPISLTQTPISSKKKNMLFFDPMR